MADCELLRRLCTAYGISGTEDAVREIIRKEVEPYAASIETDPSGNLIVEKKGAKRPKVRLMLDAHMDEVGMIVTHITDDGMLKFSCVGGIDRRVLCGTPVVVNGKYPGVIGTNRSICSNRTNGKNLCRWMICISILERQAARKHKRR